MKRWCARTFGLALMSIAACGGDDPPVIDDGTDEPGCPEGLHDGGDGACVPIGSCSPGYRPGGIEPDACQIIEPGTIRYVGPDGPAAGVTLLFHDGNGALIDRGVTDADGALSSLLPLDSEPGMVTVIVPDGDLAEGSGAPTIESEEIFVWQDYTFTVAAPAVVEPTAELVVTLPGAFEGAAGYLVDAGLVESAEITDPTQPVVLALAESDLAGKPAVVATALDALGVPLAWSAVLYPRGGPVALEAWREDFDDLELTVQSPPPDAAGFAYLAAVMPGREYATPQRIELPAGGEPETILVRVPRVAANVVLLAGFAQPEVSRGILAEPAWKVDDPSLEGEQLLPLTIDLSADLLPRVDSVTIDQTDDSGRPRISWSADGAAWSSAIVTLRYTNGAREERWAIPALGFALSTLIVPELPADLADRAPVDTGGAEVDIDLLKGYPGVDLWDLYGPYSAAQQVSLGPIRHIPPPEPQLMVTSTRR